MQKAGRSHLIVPCHPPNRRRRRKTVQPGQSFYCYVFMDGGFSNIQASRIDRWWCAADRQVSHLRSGVLCDAGRSATEAISVPARRVQEPRYECADSDLDASLISLTRKTALIRSHHSPRPSMQTGLELDTGEQSCRGRLQLTCGHNHYARPTDNPTSSLSRPPPFVPELQPGEVGYSDARRTHGVLVREQLARRQRGDGGPTRRDWLPGHLEKEELNMLHNMETFNSNRMSRPTCPQEPFTGTFNIMPVRSEHTSAV